MAKKTTMELGSVVVRIVLSVFSNRSHPRERTRNESPLEKNSPGHCKKKISFFHSTPRHEEAEAKRGNATTSRGKVIDTQTYYLKSESYVQAQQIFNEMRNFL